MLLRLPLLHLHLLRKALLCLRRLFYLSRQPLPRVGLSLRQVYAIWTFHRML